MPERFYVQTTRGTLYSANGEPHPSAGVTATVHDRAYLHQVVASFRSEDYARRTFYLGQRRRHESAAHADAEARCELLNAKHGPWPSEDAA